MARGCDAWRVTVSIQFATIFRSCFSTKRLLMNSILDQLSEGSSVVVIRIRSLGDSVLTTPAVHLLKQARPDLRIAVVSDPKFAEVWKGNPDVDAVLQPTIRDVRGFRPDLCLNLHGGQRSARLTLLSGARFRAGFAHFGYRGVYNVRIPTAQQVLSVDRKVHTAEHAASAMFHLGVPMAEIPRARLYGGGSQPEITVPGPYAVIHPIASQPEKTWPAPFFNRLAQHLRREMGLQPIFIAGPGEDVSQFQMWPVVARASLEQVKALLSNAALFIGNDSGPAHMAAAFGLPVVVIFGPSDPIVWAPWRTESRVLIADGPIESVTEEMVFASAERLVMHSCGLRSHGLQS
jgi:ADP-heptose:LPS heptosyltransferase